MPHSLYLMHAPREHAQHPCQPALCVARPGFLTVADVKRSAAADRRHARNPWSQASTNCSLRLDDITLDRRRDPLTSCETQRATPRGRP